jgi:hypothetical protein
MPVTAQLSAGLAAKSVPIEATLSPLPAKGRGKRAETGDYEKARIREVMSHAELYELRAKKMRGEMLDRALLESDLLNTFAAIRGIVLASSLSVAERRRILNELASIPIELENGAVGRNYSA